LDNTLINARYNLKIKSSTPKWTTIIPDPRCTVW
jgi:hypothetical protein